jgi:hypothetical protein
MMIFHNSTLLGICQSRCTYLYGTGEAPFASCTLRHCLDCNRWRQIYNVHFASRQNFKWSMFVPPMYSGIAPLTSLHGRTSRGQRLVQTLASHCLVLFK